MDSTKDSTSTDSNTDASWINGSATVVVNSANGLHIFAYILLAVSLVVMGLCAYFLRNRIRELRQNHLQVTVQNIFARGQVFQSPTVYVPRHLP